MFDDLLTAALVGTRSAASLPATLPDDVAALLAEPSEYAPETRLLSAVAAVTLYARAGATAVQNAARPPAAEPDDLAECSHPAADVLTRLLHEEQWDLLSEWLDLAAQAGRRPPARWLPQLLDVAVAHRRLRDAVRRVMDRRGHWLQRFNPAWEFAAETPSEDVWHTGSRDQRAALLRELRKSDPAGARTLATSTWTDDPADERERWLESFRVGLSGDDEDFLESCLDDRNAKVREAAANLLARLSDSRFVRRMIDRVEPLVHFAPGAAGSVLRLRKAVAASVEIALPEAFDKAMLRDALQEKPPERIGQKQWWLLQLVGYVPLAHWVERFRVEPAELIAALPEDFRDALIRGWTAAFCRVPHSDWALPLATSRSSSDPLRDEFLAAIPPPHRASIAERLLQSADPRVAWGIVRQLSETWRPLDQATSNIVIERCAVQALLAFDVGRYVHPSTLARLETRLLSDAETKGNKLEQALSEIALRREMHREFNP